LPAACGDDLLGGQIDPGIPRVRAPCLPGIPTVGEFLQGYEASSRFGTGASKEHAD